MTADDTTPGTGHESTDYEPGTWPLDDASDEEVADAIESIQTEIDATVQELIEALNGEPTLTDEKIINAIEAAESLQAVMTTLALRVPPEERIIKRQD